ncbi:tRNA (guanosine(46)-N7)-methyltransferase TrmB [Isoptericola sp. b441]|uniref:tRNA (guanine-N(7)-)-methyltransferase n=1 Tax=Actinotalea lenta TaxID=3064654 RepID=A0ABT9DAH6_9CELL|nr:tRNA (guanosine(46)-N7)-methyltransferase TrmB [Isoptericola sp. b441]MDO8105942.1 tRNA (guanosine(46)-N7)-methyltransferase TrmB [Isoptericola sp. b441]
MSSPGSRFTHVPDRRDGPIRTFHPRRSPLSAERSRALTELWPRFGFSVHDDALGTGPRDDGGLLDTAALFGRVAPVVLEIGSGMGEATAAMAAADRGRDYLAVEAHLPGVAQLLVLVARAGLDNVRVAHGDGLDLARRITPGSLDAVHLFFPDPWPKARHHKRRIVAPEHVALLRSRMRPGGTLHCATDWPPYAEVMLEVVAADPGLTNAYDGPAPRPPHRPITAYERRGVAAGRQITDVVATRTVHPPG